MVTTYSANRLDSIATRSVNILCPLEDFIYLQYHDRSTDAVFHPFPQNIHRQDHHKPINTMPTKMPSRFRFLDLLPELRLKIYEELLTIKPTATNIKELTFHPQILGANKQCYAEGHAVLQQVNKIELQLSAHVCPDASPAEPLVYTVDLKLGALQGNLWDIFAALPVSSGTCHDVQQRWINARQLGGKLRVSLVLNYKSTTMAQVEQFMEIMRERQQEGKLTNPREFEGVLFKTATTTLPSAEMSFAEVAQLAFALEHMAPGSPSSPVAFASSVPWTFNGSTIKYNHAYKLLTNVSQPQNVVAEKRSFLTKLAGRMPARVVKFVIRWFIDPHDPRTVEFRSDLAEVRSKLATLKQLPWKGRSSLPYAASTEVEKTLRVAGNFFELQHARHAA